MKIDTILSGISPLVKYKGLPTTTVFLKKGDQKDAFNKVIEGIMEAGNNFVTINAKVSEVPEVKTLIEGLVSKNYKVCLLTDETDQIEALFRVKNLDIVLKCSVPTAKNNKINGKNLTLLKKNDTLLFIVNKDSEVNDLLDYLASRMITNPEIVVSLSEKVTKLEESLEVLIKKSQTVPYSLRVIY